MISFRKLTYLLTYFFLINGQPEASSDEICMITVENGKFKHLGSCKNDDGSKLADLMRNNVASIKQIPDTCQIRYNGKCYRVILKKPDKDFRMAKLQCQKHGWNVSNVYDVDHFETIADNIRSRSRYWKKRQVFRLWLGMEFNIKTKEVITSGKIKINESDIKWYPSFPNLNSPRSPSFTKIQMAVRRNKTNTQQGLMNQAPSMKRMGVVCEH